MIEYQDVHKSFDVQVLKGVDLTVTTGETFGIVGPSGCGKSVLLKTTVGLITPDRGHVRIDGQSIFRSPKPVMRQVLRHHGRLRLVGIPAEVRRSQDPIVRAFTDRRPAEAGSLALLDA